MENKAPKLGSGDGMTESGTGLGQRVAAVPSAGATGTNTSNVGQGRRNCTRQVAHVVRYLSATDRHGSPRIATMRDDECKAVSSYVIT